MKRLYNKVLLFILALVLVLSLGGCKKSDEIKSEETKESKQAIDTYIKPNLGIVLIDQFDIDMMPDADDLIMFYGDSNGVSEDESVKSDKVEPFIMELFDVDEDYLRFSNYYEDGDSQYLPDPSRLGNFVDLNILETDTTDDITRIIFEYRETVSSTDNSENIYTYELFVNTSGEGVKFVSGKNIETQYAVKSDED